MTDIGDRLEELLSDPLIKLVMASDRVRPGEVRTLLEKARERGEPLGAPPPHMIARNCQQQQGWCVGG